MGQGENVVVNDGVEEIFDEADFRALDRRRVYQRGEYANVFLSDDFDRNMDGCAGQGLEGTKDSVWSVSGLPVLAQFAGRNIWRVVADEVNAMFSIPLNPPLEIV